MKKRIILIGLLIISSFSMSMELTLEKAIEEGLTRNISIRKKEISLNNNEIDTKINQKSYFPTNNFSTRVDKTKDRDSYTHNISINQTIFDGFKRRDNVEKSKINEEMTTKELQQLREDLKLQITNLYLQTLKAQNQIKIYEKSLENLEVQYKKEKIMYEQKMVSKSSILKLESSMIEIESQIVESQNRYSINIEQLKSILNYSDNTNIDLVMPEIEVETAEKIDDEWIIENETELELIDARIKLMEIDEKSINLQKLPKITASFSYGSASNEFQESFSNWETNWQIGLNFTYEIYDWGKEKLDRQKIENSIKLQKLSRQEKENELRIERKSNYYEIDKNNKLIKAKEKQIESLEESYKIDKLKYENRLIDISEFLRSEQNLVEAKVHLNDLKIENYLLKME